MLNLIKFKTYLNYPKSNQKYNRKSKHYVIMPFFYFLQESFFNALISVFTAIIIQFIFTHTKIEPVFQKIHFFLVTDLINHALLPYVKESIYAFLVTTNYSLKYLFWFSLPILCDCLVFLKIF